MFSNLWKKWVRSEVSRKTARPSRSGARRARLNVECLEERDNPSTTLGVGDIAFTGMQTDAPDTFSFVLLKDVDSGTQLSFTDNGWRGAQNGFNATEQTATVTFGNIYTAGTHFVVVDGGAPQFRIAGGNTSAGTASGSLTGLSASGDSVLAYQGTAPTTGNATNWVAGIISLGAGWNSSYTSGSNDSALPTALTNGVNAIAYYSGSGDRDSGWLNLGSVSGDAASIRNDESRPRLRSR